MRARALAALAQGVAKTHGATTRAASPHRSRVDCRRERCVALTYDDGPGLPTPRLLDVLRRHHARATFFVVGEMVQQHPGTARRIARAAQIIRRVTGTNPTLMRPPYGSSNGRVRRIERQLGLAEIMWDVDTADWRDRHAGLVSARALRGVRYP
jgi:peptidoglycan/xylan/chitin deacetylase (PgdA/CDA1 family)